MVNGQTALRRPDADATGRARSDAQAKDSAYPPAATARGGRPRSKRQFRRRFTYRPKGRRRGRSSAGWYDPERVSDPKTWLEVQLAVHVIDHRARHRARAAHGGTPAPSYWPSTIQRVLQESLCMRLQRRQTRFQELAASEVCSFSLEDALCATHLLSQVLPVNSSSPTKLTTTNAYQQDPIVGQQKAKEFSCHTPLTKDADRGDAAKNRKETIADR